MKKVVAKRWLHIRDVDVGPVYHNLKTHRLYPYPKKGAKMHRYINRRVTVCYGGFIKTYGYLRKDEQGFYLQVIRRVR